MTCFECCKEIQSYPCACGYQPKALAVTKPLNWIIQHCSTPKCETAIRVRATETLANPICKWCDQKISHATNGKDWPDGMPDPSLPWPWMTDKEREKKIALPYWQARFRRHPKYYQPFILKQTPQPTEVIEAEV